MKRFAFYIGSIGLIAATFAWLELPNGGLSMADESTAGEPKLVHSVYFTLRDNSSTATRQLVDSCYKHLSGIDGITSFAAGTLVEDLNRPVNDRDFHVGLNVVFKNRKALDAYATHAQHLKFIAENQANWGKVRVFDVVAR